MPLFPSRSALVLIIVLLLLNLQGLLDGSVKARLPTLTPIYENTTQRAPTGPLDFAYFTDKFENLRNLTSLRDVPLRFYLYEQNNSNRADQILSTLSIDEMPRHLREPDIFLHNVLIRRFQSSHLRTTDPNQADLFVIPVNVNLMGKIGRGIGRSKASRLKAAHAAALETVLSSPTFQMLQGHRHVVVSIFSRAFHARWGGRFSQYEELDNLFYKRMVNVTTAKDKDTLNCDGLSRALRAQGKTDFASLFDTTRPATSSSFSVGLLSGVGLPFVNATKERLDNASLHFFYHSRKGPFLSNSTVYRHWPMRNMNWTRLPKSSIGYDLDSETWLREFQDSKFCLVIRGDEPGSHALVRSVRTGCIPVLISDWLPLYNPVFKSTLDLTDFSIMIPEQDFLDDAEGELQKVVNLPSDVIDDKLRALQYAQSIMLHDSPLFVEAFLKEAALSWNDRTDR